MKKTKEIDYYGIKDNYIHLKFGNAWKMYNFTDTFKKKYPKFMKEYMDYFNQTGQGRFNNAYTVIKYIKDYKIPVHLYFNYTDEPATVEEALDYFFRENTIHNDLEIK